MLAFVVIIPIIIIGLMIFFYVTTYSVISVYCLKFIKSKYGNQIDSWLEKSPKNKVRLDFLIGFIVIGVPLLGVDMFFWISVMPSQDITISNLFSKYISLIIGICMFYISIVIKNKLVAINPIFGKITKIIFILFICFVLSGLFLSINSPTNTNSSEQSFYILFWIFLVSPIIFRSVILYDDEIKKIK